MRISVGVLPAVVVVGVLLSACGSSAQSGTTPSVVPSSMRAASAPNPVTMLKKLDGCVLPAGSSVGETDMDGNRYASCDYMDNGGSAGTNVTVYTSAAGAPLAQLPNDDSHKVIVGSHFIAGVTGDWSAYSSTFDVDSVAQSLGGKVVAPGR